MASVTTKEPADLAALRAKDPKRADREARARVARAKLAKKARPKRRRAKAEKRQPLKADTSKPGKLAEGVDVLQSVQVGPARVELARVTCITREAKGRGPRLSHSLGVLVQQTDRIGNAIELHALAETIKQFACELERLDAGAER